MRNGRSAGNFVGPENDKDLSLPSDLAVNSLAQEEATHLSSKAQARASSSSSSLANFAKPASTNKLSPNEAGSYEDLAAKALEKAQNPKAQTANETPAASDNALGLTSKGAATTRKSPARTGTKPGAKRRTTRSSKKPSVEERLSRFFRLVLLFSGTLIVLSLAAKALEKAQNPKAQTANETPAASDNALGLTSKGAATTRKSPARTGTKPGAKRRTTRSSKKPSVEERLSRFFRLVLLFSGTLIVLSLAVLIFWSRVLGSNQAADFNRKTEVRDPAFFRADGRYTENNLRLNIMPARFAGKKFPLVYNRDVTLERVTVGPGSVVTNYFSISQAQRKRQTPEGIATQLCASKSLRTELIDMVDEYRLIYSSEGQDLYKITLTSSTCDRLRH